MFYLASEMSALRKGSSVGVEAGQNVFVREKPHRIILMLLLYED